MDYQQVLKKHGYALTSEGFYKKSNKHLAEKYRYDVNRIRLYSPAGGYTLSGRTHYDTNYISPTPEQLDTMITVLTAE